MRCNPYESLCPPRPVSPSLSLASPSLTTPTLLSPFVPPSLRVCVCKARQGENAFPLHSLHPLRPPSCDVVVEDDLEVLVGLDLRPRGVIGGGGVRIDVDEFAIPLVLEQKPDLAVRDHLEVGRRVGRRRLRLPVVKAQVRGFRKQALLALKHHVEVLRLKPMRKVDVARDLLALGVLVTDEDDRHELAASDGLLALRQRHEQGLASEILVRAVERLRTVQELLTTRPLSSLLPLLEVLAFQDLARASIPAQRMCAQMQARVDGSGERSPSYRVYAHPDAHSPQFDELSCELDVLQVAHCTHAWAPGHLGLPWWPLRDC